jgi:N-acetyl-D-muramate 6-phosphate phosphatase
MNSIPFHQIHAILFDLDGTLIEIDDSVMIQMEKRLQPILGRHTLKVVRWLMAKAEIPGNQLITLLDFFGLDEALTVLTDKLRRHQGFYPPQEFQLIQDVSDMLLDLSSHYRIALVSTRSRYQIENFFKEFPQEAAVFQTSCGRQDTRHLKPHPAPVQLAANRLGVAIENCLMVGDTVVDIQSARRSGAWSVGVLCGFGEQNEFERAGAHLILNRTSDLRKHLTFV